jgi:hypothetical protein
LLLSVLLLISRPPPRRDHGELRGGQSPAHVLGVGVAKRVIAGVLLKRRFDASQLASAVAIPASQNLTLVQHDGTE